MRGSASELCFIKVVHINSWWNTYEAYRVVLSLQNHR